MPFALDQVVPWGRSFDEYCRLFALTAADLQKSLLGCADGPAAFNAELTRRGGRIVSCDPLYAYSSTDIAARIDACFETVLQQTRADAAGFVWSDLIPDVAALARVRRAAMDEFLADYPAGQAVGRYRAGELPDLPFADGQFDCALCSHFLFLYDRLGAAFHLQAVRELLRVACEVRIFPLVQLDRKPSPYLQPVMELARSLGAVPNVITVAYEFQRGGNQMLQIRRGS